MILSGILLASCVTTSMSVPKVNQICTTIFKPILWNHADTIDTIKAVKQHNAVWDDLNTR